MRSLGLISAALMLSASVASANDLSPKGYWLTENGKAVVQFADCEGAKLCGHIVWTANPRDASGDLKLDLENPDPKLRNKPLCGIRLIGGMAPKSTTKYVDGWVYNPRSGQTFSAEVSVLSEDRLKMRGFLGISLLGKTQTWKRVSDDRGGCK